MEPGWEWLEPGCETEAGERLQLLRRLMARSAKGASVSSDAKGGLVVVMGEDWGQGFRLGVELLLRVVVRGEAWKRSDREGVVLLRISAVGGALECAAPVALVE